MSFLDDRMAILLTDTQLRFLVVLSASRTAGLMLAQVSNGESDVSLGIGLLDR